MNQKRIKGHHHAKGGQQYHYQMVPLRTHLDEKPAPILPGACYIHVPFCSKICSFCSMRRQLSEPIDNYADKIIEEIKFYADFEYVQQQSFHSIYFGGGTPTTLSGKDLVRIVTALKTYLPISENAEISSETTLSELPLEKLHIMHEGGFNRISVGVQTFQTKGREILGRKGDKNFAVARLQDYQNMGFPGVNIDLIYNYPGQTQEDLIEDIRLTDELGCRGFSMYSLMNMRHETGPQEGSSENDRLFFDTIATFANARGFHFLEGTKMVKDDKYQYIVTRLRGGDTIPLGAGAGGSLAGAGCMNPFDLKKYNPSAEKMVMALPPEEARKKWAEDRIRGELQLLHLNKSTLTHPTHHHLAETLVTQGFLTDQGDHYAHTKEGIYMSHNIMAAFTEALEL